MPLSAQLEGVWSEEDTSPSHIEDALRNLLVESYEKERAYAPATSGPGRPKKKAAGMRAQEKGTRVGWLQPGAAGERGRST